MIDKTDPSENSKSHSYSLMALGESFIYSSRPVLAVCSWRKYFSTVIHVDAASFRQFILDNLALPVHWPIIFVISLSHLIRKFTNTLIGYNRYCKSQHKQLVHCFNGLYQSIKFSTYIYLQNIKLALNYIGIYVNTYYDTKSIKSHLDILRFQMY